MIECRAAREPGIKGISSMATRAMLRQLTQAYGDLSGMEVTIEAVGGVAAARRVAEGEPFDVVVLAADAIERLIADGRLMPDSRVDLARSGVSMAVKAGTAPPEIGSEAAVRAAVLAAPSIGYSTGPSGVHLTRLFARWGIADIIAPRIVQASPGVPVATLVARGEVALGFQQSSELLHEPGIAIIGSLPAAIQCMTVFAAAIGHASTRQAAARALLSFLASPEADAA
ncbi:MAG: substrate-binding domain-containing protein, partial [Janthinobacterium lividum]